MSADHATTSTAGHSGQMRGSGGHCGGACGRGRQGRQDRGGLVGNTPQLVRRLPATGGGAGC
jgi:hypothetical protein